MTANQLFAISDTGIVPLDIGDATSLTNLYADLPLGVYSSLRTFEHNRFLALEAHIERTARSMALLGWEYELDRMRLRRALDEAANQYPGDDARVRFDVLAGPAEALGTASRELIALTPFTPQPQAVYRQGVGADFVPALSRYEPLAKTAEFSERRSRMLPIRNRAHYEYLLLGENDDILEGTLSNFWVVRDGQVWTAAEGVLEGVTRGILLDLIPGLGIPLGLQARKRRELATFDEAFISGSSRAVVPVVRIASYEIGDGRPGPITRHIMRAYDAYVWDHIQTAV